TIRGGCQEGRDVPALAPAHAADSLRINPAFTDQVINSRDHIPRVTHAQVADVELPELLAVPAAAPIIHLHHQCTARRPNVRRIQPGVEQDWTVDTRRAAVNDAEQRILFAWIEIDGFDQYAFDGCAVFAPP